MMVYIRRSLAVSLLLLGAACGSKESPAGLDPDESLGTMTATIDGSTKFNGRGEGSVGELVTVLGGVETKGNLNRQIAFVLVGVNATGRYALSAESGRVASILEGAGLAYNAWRSDLPGASGYIEITRLTKDRIAGRFAFSAQPAVESPARGTRQIAAGEFDFPIERE